MIGYKVHHNNFGDGTIIDRSGNLLTVDFNGNKKKFIYPDAFEKFLKSANHELMLQVNGIDMDQVPPPAGALAQKKQ